MVKINQEIKFKLTIAIAVASFVCVVFVAHLLSGVVDNVKRNRVKIAEIERDIILLDQITQQTQIHRDNIRKVRSTLPSEYYEISFFFVQLEQLAQSNNLSIEISIEPNRKVESAAYDTVAFALNLQGSYSNVTNFLAQLTKLAYHTQVDYLNMSDEGGSLSTDMKLRLFVDKK